MRSIMWLLGLPAALLWSEYLAVAAEGQQAMSQVPRPGDIVPPSIRVIGIDGESVPRRYGMLIIGGRFIVLVEAGSRRVVEVVSDAPLSLPATRSR